VLLKNQFNLMDSKSLMVCITAKTVKANSTPRTEDAICNAKLISAITASLRINVSIVLMDLCLITTDV